jgi:hypothetical protein
MMSPVLRCLQVAKSGLLDIRILPRTVSLTAPVAAAAASSAAGALQPDEVAPLQVSSNSALSYTTPCECESPGHALNGSFGRKIADWHPFAFMWLTWNQGVTLHYTALHCTAQQQQQLH